MKGYRERYRPVPLFTEGYRPAQGYRHVQGGVQDTSLDRGTGLYWRGGRGGVYRTVQWVQACTGVKACTCREGYKPGQGYRPVLGWVGGTGLYEGTGLYRGAGLYKGNGVYREG